MGSAVGRTGNGSSHHAAKLDLKISAAALTSSTAKVVHFLKEQIGKLKSLYFGVFLQGLILDVAKPVLLLACVFQSTVLLLACVFQSTH